MKTRRALGFERAAWEVRLAQFPDRQVLVHGDATPTNFLFPDHGGRGGPPHGRAVALDLERLRPADRLWDLSWVAGELKHAWAWRTGHAAAAEAAIGHFFRLIWRSQPDNPDLAERLYLLNPFYMALAELRIARNGLSRLGLPPLAGGRGPAVFDLRQAALKAVSSFEFLVSS